MKYCINVVADGGSAQVRVIDDNNEVRADVYVEVLGGEVRLVVTPNIVERDSDDPEFVALIVGQQGPLVNVA